MKDIFCLDIETIPQKQWREQDYKPDMYWRKQRWMEQQATGNAPTPERPDYPMHLTGDLPSTHPATAHIVSVSCAMDLGAKSTQREIPGLAPEAQVIQVDQHLHPVLEGDDERPPMLREITTDDMLDAERMVVSIAFEKLAFAVRHGLTVVTFNGKGFDLPMLRWRAAMLGLAIPGVLRWYEMTYPYRHKEHIDLRLLFSDGDRRARGTMAMWCTAFGIDAKTIGTGADVLGWVEQGGWNQLLSYGLDEMDDLIQLFRAVEGAL